MVTVRVYPHRRADGKSIEWGPWWMDTGGTREELPPFLKGWDYAREQIVGITARVDRESLLTSTGLKALDEIELVAIADCNEAVQRFVTRQRLSELHHKEVDLAIRLPAGEVAGSVRLSAHAVLADSRPSGAARVAAAKGARLLESPTVTLRLEGDASRFPTEALAFSNLGFDNAPWTLITTYSDLGESFAGGVRLLINTENPVGQLALQGDSSKLVLDLLRADVMRLLLAVVAGQSEERFDQDFPEGSVGQVLQSLTRTFFQRELDSVVQLVVDDPLAFDRLLQDRMAPFEEVAK